MHRTEYSDALEEARYAVAKASYEVKWLLAHLARKRFDPNQPRVPAGNRDGGQWTAGGSSGGRTQVAARVPRVVQPRQRLQPGRRPVDSGGGVEWLTPAEIIQLNSSKIPAESLANVLRNHSPDWQPTPHMVTSAAGAIKANQAVAAEAASRLREINAALWSDAPTQMILMPAGNPIGYVHGRAGGGIRTLNAREEFDLVLTRLIIHAEPVSHPRYSGQVFLRRDGVLVGIRESWDSGPTIDILKGNERIPAITKIHLRHAHKSHVPDFWHRPILKGLDHMIPPMIRRTVRQVDCPRLDQPIEALGMTFREYCDSFVQDPGEPNNFSVVLQVIVGVFGSDKAELEAALRYLLTHFVGNGLAPMNFENAVDYEYGPVTKYGVRPQEIIDNIVEAWRRGGDRFVETCELMFGWERDCGAFIVDDGPETRGGGG